MNLLPDQARRFEGFKAFSQRMQQIQFQLVENCAANDAIPIGIVGRDRSGGGNEERRVVIELDEIDLN